MDTFAGIMLFALAGFVSAAFYTPLKYVKWSWELMWIFYALFACLVAPMIVASFAIPSCWSAIGAVDSQTVFMTFLFGLLWGIGGLTFGLSMRYLGIGLGTAVALGFCALVGTLIPPIRDGRFMEILSTREGLTVLIGVFICMLGIAINGAAGIMKERDTASGVPGRNEKVGDADVPASESSSSGKSEFSLAKGFAVAIIAGALSACMSISIEWGKPIAEQARQIAVLSGVDAARANLFQNSAILIVTLIGGFLSNFIWCFFLSIKNKSFVDFKKTGAVGNFIFLLLCALGGVLWYCQFFLYGMGQTKLAEQYSFAAWAMLMAFVIIFAGLIGLIIGEWKGTSSLTKFVLWLGILVLVSSTFVIGIGNA